MPIFYSDNQTEFELTEPNFTRWRHRLRGPRESYKHNIHADQVEYDFHSLYAIADALDERMEAGFALLEFGGEIDADVYWDDATPTEEPIVIEGLETLVANIERLKLRVAALEA